MWPLNGDATAFYFEETRGAYSVEVKCADCERTTFVVWDDYPGPIEELETGTARLDQPGGAPVNRQYYLAIKLTVRQAILQGVSDFKVLVQQAEKGLPGQFDMKELRPLLRRAWIELHRGI